MATYNPKVFDTPDLEAAKQIILTPEGSSTAERWAIETHFLTDLIGGLMKLNPESLVLDYGCGIGRMSKALIEKYGCWVIGVDMSADMRALAPGYVASERFIVCSAAALDGMVRKGLQFDAAISIWVLQHCLKPATDIALIGSALKRRDGQLFVLNNIYRAVPAREQAWVNDGMDIRAMLSHEFTAVEMGALPNDKIAKGIIGLHFWGLFRNHRI